jgi:hypothetical protein
MDGFEGSTYKEGGERASLRRPVVYEDATGLPQLLRFRRSKTPKSAVVFDRVDPRLELPERGARNEDPEATRRGRRDRNNSSRGGHGNVMDPVLHRPTHLNHRAGSVDVVEVDGRAVGR